MTMLAPVRPYRVKGGTNDVNFDIHQRMKKKADFSPPHFFKNYKEFSLLKKFVWYFLRALQKLIIVDLQCCANLFAVQQSDPIVCIYIYIYIYTHTHTYIIRLILSFIMVFPQRLGIVPGAPQQGLTAYPF